MSIFNSKFKEIFSAQVVSIFGGLIAGTILVIYTDKILLIPGMLILLPGFLEMRGNISGTLAARITSGLFLKVIGQDKINTRIIRQNIWASFLLAIFISFVLGIVAFAFNYFAMGIFLPKIIWIPIIAGIIANAIEIPLTIFCTFYFFRKGHDPDNIMGPFVTSAGDVTSVLALLIALVLIWPIL